MSIRIRFRREAEAEVIDALSWYRERGVDLAGEFRKSLDSCLASIQHLPESHPVVHRDIRRALMKRFPYGLFYVREGDLIAVLAYFHAKRDPAIWKARAR
ncbi:MAG: type II toxin-antitoxin system RelE/ParE family toxin [Nitrospira sp.]|nr:type II toxin-antitoxin system RelE/ParE family toxin [Nitrospira sp.]